ncbi:MAG: tetratricopeptide repeat protein [Gemmatimonadetes bacterium]|nr:tetratricopeptide repeat protein [Gemmatimonadota bacterium]
MLRYVPRALIGAAAALSVVACAGAGGGAASAPTEGGGSRYRILVPTFEAQGAQPAVAERVANDLRGMISGMATHTAVPVRELRGAMRQHDVEQLDAVSARQIAQLINSQQVLWGTVQPGGEGFVANVTFTDVGSGDQIEIEGATGANPRQLAQSIFQQLESSIQGIALASFCNDYLASQQFDRALENCERALEIVPQSTLALYGMATALFHEERFDEALATYERLLTVDPTHQDALLGAGLTASQLDQSQQALGYYNRYLELNPGDITIRMRVAGDIAQTGDVVSAYRVLEPALAENTDNLDFQQYLAQVATAAGQRVAEQGDAAASRQYFETALGAYDRVFAARGDDLDAGVLRQAIAVNMEMGREQEALQLAEQATQRFADDAGVWSQYGSLLSRLNRHADAARALTRVIQIDPQFENAHIRRALAYMEAGQRQQALRDLEVAAQGGNREQVAQAIYSMAAAPLRAERWSEAETLLAMAHGYAAGTTRSDIAFYWGVSLYRQAEAIARANTQGRAADARRALAIFERALPRLQESNNPGAAQVVGAAREYIANQQAIIQAARGG